MKEIMRSGLYSMCGADTMDVYDIWCVWKSMCTKFSNFDRIVVELDNTMPNEYWEK